MPKFSSRLREALASTLTVIYVIALLLSLGCDVAAAANAALASRYAKLPLAFEENRGQAEPRARFLARGPGYSLLLSPTAAVLRLRAGGTLPIAYPARRNSLLRMRLEGANPKASAIGVDPLSGKSNYFIGTDRSRWRTNVPTFAGVRVRDVYPGIEVVYRGTEGRLEYDFAIAAGADPKRIRLGIDGARNLSIDSSGDLIIRTDGGSVVQKAPVIYQISQLFRGAKRMVSGGYVMRDAHTVGFALGDYDRGLPLIIDPLLSYASYLGGSLIDFGAAIAVDSSGEAIVTGYTDSDDFPITSDAFQPNLFEAAGGADDVFISKINPSGTALVYSTYAGGSNEDEATSIAVDAAGNAYVAGFTMSPDYPVTVGAFQTSLPGSRSAFITALDQNGGLIYSTFLNGSATSSAAGVAADASGNAFVTGVTTSIDFPVTAGAYQTSFTTSSGHDRAAFVAKLNPSGTALEYSTFLGPPNYLAGSAIALDAAGDAYITGPGYPGGTIGAATCPSIAADCGFVARLNPLADGVGFATLLNLPDSQNGAYTEPRSIAVDPGGAHVVGNFGVSGAHFGFLDNLDSTGSMINLVNLSNTLSPNAIAVGRSGNIFIAGTAYGNSLATTLGAFQTDDAGSINGFLNEYDSRGLATLYSTYLGGSDQDEAFGVALDPWCNAYVTGYTQSSDFPVTPGALQATHGGAVAHAGTLDAFVARIVASPALSPTPTASATTTASPTMRPTVAATATPTPTPTVARTPLPTRVPPTITATAMPTPIATPPVIVAPNPLEFQSLKIGRPSALRILVVINPANQKAPAAIVGFAIGTENGTGAPADFIVNPSRSTCVPGLVLAAGKSCRIAVAFEPKATGLRRNVLTVSVAADRSPPAPAARVRLLSVGK